MPRAMQTARQPDRDKPSSTRKAKNLREETLSRPAKKKKKVHVAEPPSSGPSGVDKVLPVHPPTPHPAKLNIALKPAVELQTSGTSTRKRGGSNLDSVLATPANVNDFISGRLELFAMSNEALRNAIQPPTSKRLNYTALLRLIREKPAAFKAGELEVFFPPSDSPSGGFRGGGTLTSGMPGFCRTTIQPTLSRTPYPIELTEMLHMDRLPYSTSEKALFWPESTANRPLSPGFEGALRLAPGPAASSLKLREQDAVGRLLMNTRPVFGGGADAVYHGVAQFIVTVKHGPGELANLTSKGGFAFWAVRPKEHPLKTLALAAAADIAATAQPGPSRPLHRTESLLLEGTRRLAAPNWSERGSDDEEEDRDGTYYVYNSPCAGRGSGTW
ncbi:hypothetical protein MKEN_00185700 [Mycena kentingensis (nom. inval.)]|nr:hypothetical protein MKEN_00185700 [Mycena kentingensis (nom. inval.)]